ncbi:MAG TPA: hypothetical protein VLV78_20925 [Thermoanaerobaculia bacterium]|nr:hypothetical protein [Thermoanaerobaculia bacterium]
MDYDYVFARDAADRSASMRPMDIMRCSIGTFFEVTLERRGSLNSLEPCRADAELHAYGKTG